VAGCADIFDCRRILKQLDFILATVLELDEPLGVADASVKMINTNFSLNASVNLNKVIQQFAVRQGFKVTFDPDRYSAVKVKFTPRTGQKQVTASIFSTGKIIVTGAQTLEEIAGAYETINNVMTADALVKPVTEPELFDIIMGASFEEWVRVLGKK
jgi:TATA-box binding protein (TBP) (component of TFIID and TFIIIB)